MVRLERSGMAGCRMQLLHPLLAGIFLAAGEGCEPSLTDPEGDVQPQKVQAAPPCSKSSSTLRLLPSFSAAWNRNRRRFVDVEQDRGIVFPLNSRQLYLPGAASLSKARKYRAGVLPSWGARLAVNFRERPTGELWRTLSRRSLHNTHFGE